MNGYVLFLRIREEGPMLKCVLKLLFLFGGMLISSSCLRADGAKVGMPIRYSLPGGGLLPKTYRVTLAIVDPKNPDWIVSQFLAGEPRTVTRENAGQFTDYWDGLDDNFMPVPPGVYGLKGIFMPADKWQVDGEYHSIVPQFVTGISPWVPRPEQWKDPARLYAADPASGPSHIMDVDVGTNSVAVFYYGYLEIIANNVQVDLKKPIGYEQLLRTYDSGGAGGGPCTCTDGESIWGFSTDGGLKFIYRADGKPFGDGAGANRRNVTLAKGWVKSLAAYRDRAAGKSYVYVAEGGRIIAAKRGWPDYYESDTEFIDRIVVLAGESGRKLAELPVRRPRSVVARYGTLYVLHQNDAGAYLVSTAALAAGVPQGTLHPLFTVAAAITPFDLEQDSHGRFYLSDPGANKVYQLDREGRILRTFGRLNVQKPGSYDPETFMSPGKLATWRDPDGNDRLLVVDQAGPTNTSEWSAEGRLLRQFIGLQTNCNNYGYTIDREHPEDLYIIGAQGWLTRFRMDYAGATWKVDAVWPDIGTEPLFPQCAFPRIVNWNGQKYLCCSSSTRTCSVYRLDGDRWLLSAGILRKTVNNRSQWFSWHDANGDGKVQEEEYRDSPMQLPGFVLKYFGEQWLDDLSLMAINQNGRDIWRLIPTGFDEHQNPIFTRWEKVITDPIFQARSQNTADAIHGGNELDDRFSSDWAMARGSVRDGFYVTARGGQMFSANMSGQDKISRYVPDGKGGYAMKWRTGRQALNGRAKQGEIVGSIFIEPPINGLLSVIDNSRSGVLLYTEDGLYVETLFPQRPASEVGIFALPGEFFQGVVYPNRNDGSIYIGVGKATPLIFKAEGWSLTRNPVQRLTTLPKTVMIAASQIADPPEIALTMRGNAGVQKIVRFAPATGGAVLDGSMAGWESCEPVQFQADDRQTVEVRTIYDPENLYLRWHARLSNTFDPKPLLPVERIFSHGRLADTLSFYIQGDLNAKPTGPVDGRPGDVRIVLGIFKDVDTLRPVALGMYPAWQGVGKPMPQSYQSPTGKVEFAHVGPLVNAKLNFVMDEDRKGFVLVAGIPRSAIPGLPRLSGDVRTMVNFEATFAGHNKFWWANSDGSANSETYDEPSEARLYPGSWAPAQFQDLAHALVLRNWLICGPFGGPGAEKFTPDLSDQPLPGTKKGAKQAGREFCEAASYPPDDKKVDLRAVYRGELVGGYWQDPGQVRWRSAKTADLDTRVICGPAAQVWYGASWILAPAETTVKFQFQGHPQTYYRWFLNSEKVLDGQIGITGEPGVVEKTVTLRHGWNQV
ncbi:MAG: hypothetical protein ABR915_09860, partial [Thermoguttaceae bacterium]